MISQGLIPRGYQQARAHDTAAEILLRCEVAVDRAAVQVNHREKLIQDPRWSSSLHFRAELERWRERHAKAVADLAEARGAGRSRPMYAGRAAEDRDEPPVVVEGEVLKHSGWLEKNDHRRRVESAESEQAE